MDSNARTPRYIPVGIGLKSRLSVWVASGKLTVSELENGQRAIDIMSFPMNSMVIFNSYVSLPEGKIKNTDRILQTSGGK